MGDESRKVVLNEKDEICIWVTRFRNIRDHIRKCIAIRYLPPLFLTFWWKGFEGGCVPFIISCCCICQSYYHPQQQLREGNVFTGVCQPFCSQGVLCPFWWVGISGTRSLLGVGMPGGDVQGRIGLWLTTPCYWHLVTYGWQAGSWYPTGMFSCFVSYFRFVENSWKELSRK